MTKADVQYRMGRGLAGMVAGTLRLGERCAETKDLTKARMAASKALHLLREFPQIPAGAAEMLRSRVRRLEMLIERDAVSVVRIGRTEGQDF